MNVIKLTDEILSSTYVIKMLDERIEDGMNEETLNTVEENLSKGLSLINDTLEVITKELMNNPDKLTLNDDINISNLEITKELNKLSDNNDLPLQ